jgi:hypothetical protein
VLSAIAVVPSTPLVVPELATGAAVELADLSAAVLSAAATLPDRWIVVGVGQADGVIGPDGIVGSFGGYGADVRVSLSPDGVGVGDLRPPRPLPLCALIAGWVRAEVAPQARAEVWVYAADHEPDAALDRGRALRAETDATAEPIGVLVVADGANTLTPPAPGGYDPESVAVQEMLDDALARGDTAALARLPAGIVGRVAYQALAGLMEPSPSSARELYRGAPYGVGYFVGTWAP